MEINLGIICKVVLVLWEMAIDLHDSIIEMVTTISRSLAIGTKILTIILQGSITERRTIIYLATTTLGMGKVLRMVLSLATIMEMMVLFFLW